MNDMVFVLLIYRGQLFVRDNATTEKQKQKTKKHVVLSAARAHELYLIRFTKTTSVTGARSQTEEYPYRAWDTKLINTEDT